MFDNVLKLLARFVIGYDYFSLNHQLTILIRQFHSLHSSNVKMVASLCLWISFWAR